MPLSYQQKREKLLHDIADRWQNSATEGATNIALEAEEVIRRIVEQERTVLYDDQPRRALPNPGSLIIGGRYLTNQPKIESSRLYKIARSFPKGAHLHLHFNTELPPDGLLKQVRGLSRTFCICSSRALITSDDLKETEIQFSVRPEDTKKANIFSEEYGIDHWMLWTEFRFQFQEHFPDLQGCNTENLDPAERWARDKLVLDQETVYAANGTLNKTWACFHRIARALEGLVNYESGYKWYIRQAIDRMVTEKIMYAELRMTFYEKFIPSDDGTTQLDHADQMNILREVIIEKKQQYGDKFPFGLKVVYSVPRSIPKEEMKKQLDNCMELESAYPDLICGLDLVGSEDRLNGISHYGDLLTEFRKRCKVPFLFHAGETVLDMDGSVDLQGSNLIDAVLLGTKRIGHGTALLQHPPLIEMCKRHNICVELCLVSDEILGLCRDVRQHPYRALLALGLPCTLNADNLSIMSTSLSSEFYQAMIGDPRMTLHGWKQLAEWSIEYSCLGEQQIGEAVRLYRAAFETFCKDIVSTYSATTHMK